MSGWKQSKKSWRDQDNAGPKKRTKRPAVDEKRHLEQPVEQMVSVLWHCDKRMRPYSISYFDVGEIIYCQRYWVCDYCGHHDKSTDALPACVSTVAEAALFKRGGD